ncbi:MAG: hypothetical protein PHE87_03175 [Victivallaceae bacterium]|nr:hypothetical protein [Victivallaceae bacterium]
MARAWLVGIIFSALIGAGCGDNAPPVQKIDPAKAEMIKQVQRERSSIARFQIQVRGRYNAQEYMQCRFHDEFSKTSRLRSAERTAARKKLLAQAKEEIKRHEAEFASLGENYRDTRSQVSLTNLQRAATANFDLGIRISADVLNRQEISLRERQMRFERDRNKLTTEKREAEESALEKLHDSVAKRRAHITLVNQNRDAVINMTINALLRN